MARITFCACVIGGPQLTSSRRHLPQLDLPHRSLTIVRLIPYLYRSGDASAYELIRELARQHEIPDHVLIARFERYAALDPEILRALGDHEVVLERARAAGRLRA